MWIRLARLTAVVAGGVLTAAAGTVALTAGEGVVARRRLTPTRVAASTAASGLFGAEHDGSPLQLVIMGDSLAVGYGADSPAETVGVKLAEGLVSASGRPVQLRNVGEVGAESMDLIAQLLVVRRLQTPPDVAVIVVGANDAMRLRPLADSLRPLRATITELRRLGARVVVATCPDLGTVRTFFQPLRLFAHWISRLLATSQTIVALRAGARTVSLGDALGPLFRRDPASMFSQLDRLHPSGLGYTHAAEVLLPSVRAAAGYPEPGARSVPHRAYDKGGRRTLIWLAFRASRHAGTRLRHLGGATVPSA